MNKNKSILTFLIFISTTALAQTPAFPGAEGFGRYVTGGRGGKVVHVTNLNDSGTGSLRAAVSGSSDKIVVFDVGGVIPLSSDLSIGANTTVEGQTAPYPGITIRYYTVRPKGNNIILRFLRFRRGQEKDVNDGADAIWARQYTGMILDHCSMSWSIDELASFYDNNNFTLQWCSLGESLNNAGHGKGAHGYGGIWGGKLASFHHNFLGYVNNRAPRFDGARYNWSGYTANTEYDKWQWKNTVQAEIVDFRNCVMFNWGDGNGCYGGPGGGYINIVNNYYKAGPATKNATRVTEISVGNSDNSTVTALRGLTSRYYINGNYVTAASSPENYDWNGVTYDSGTSYDADKKAYYVLDPNHYYTDNDTVWIKMTEPTLSGEVTTHSAQQAFDNVLNYAGASFYRDTVDARYAIETRSGQVQYIGSVTQKAGIIDLVSDVEGYTEANFPTGSRTDDYDTDNDGMPDTWEKANALDPNDSSDAQTYTLDPKGYYTNVEVFCNSLVEDLMKQENQDAESQVDEYYPETVRAEGVDYYTGRHVQLLSTGIDTVGKSAGKMVKTEYFNLAGQRVNPSAKGFLLIREKDSDNRTHCRKVIR